MQKLYKSTINDIIRNKNQKFSFPINTHLPTYDQIFYKSYPVKANINCTILSAVFDHLNLFNNAGNLF